LLIEFYQLLVNSGESISLRPDYPDMELSERYCLI